MATVLFLVAAATSHLPASNPTVSQGFPQNSNAVWFSCETANRRHCHAYVMARENRKPVGYWQVKKGVKYVVYPFFKHRVKRATAIVRQATRAVSAFAGRTETWLITWYEATGQPMASGQMPFVGAAACGWDVSLGTRIYVAGLGSYICLDREGFMPFHHADLFEVPLGTGYRSVTIAP